MSEFINSRCSLKARKAYENLSESQKRVIGHLVNYLPELVEKGKATLIDNTRVPFEYKFRWKSIKVHFKILPKSQTPVLLDIFVY